MWFVTDSDHSWMRLSDPAGFIFFSAHTINDRLFFNTTLTDVTDFARSIDWTNDVDLIILPGAIALVDVYDVVGIVNPKHWIARVPMDVVTLLDTGNGF